MDTTPMDGAYVGREQSLIKHHILEGYLLPFAIKVGKWADRIVYLDGFSGPWQASSENYDDTSFGIALRVLRKARKTVGEVFKRDLRITGIFLEKEEACYRMLDAYAKQQHDIDTITFNSNFEQTVPDLVKAVKSQGGRSFAFILIDPKGWKGFSMELIRPLIQVERSEVLVNFMTGHIIRFIETERGDIKESFRRLFGDDTYERSIMNLSGLKKETAIVLEYAKRLKGEGGFSYFSIALVQQPTRDRTHFHLVYATRHIEGVRVFKKAESSALELSKQTRGLAKQRKRVAESSQGELFCEKDEQHLSRLQDEFESRAIEDLEGLIRKKGAVAYEVLYTTVMKYPVVQEPFLIAWIKQAGGVFNPSSDRRRNPRFGDVVCFPLRASR